MRRATCWLMKHGNDWLLWDTGVPESAHNDPKGWSTLPKLIVYHLDKTLTDQFAEIGLKPAISAAWRYRIPTATISATWPCSRRRPS